MLCNENNIIGYLYIVYLWKIMVCFEMMLFNDGVCDYGDGFYDDI